MAEARARTNLSSLCLGSVSQSFPIILCSKLIFKGPRGFAVATFKSGAEDVRFLSSFSKVLNMCSKVSNTVGLNVIDRCLLRASMTKSLKQGCLMMVDVRPEFLLPH